MAGNGMTERRENMIKIIAKYLNKRRDEKRQTKVIEIGQVYFVTHSYKKDFYIKVRSVNDVWVEGISVNTGALIESEEIIIMRKLCKFTKLED
jgi:hypothetical protein